MKLYQYIAKDQNGRTVRDTISAEDVSDFYRHLEQNGLLCCEYREREAQSNSFDNAYRLRNKDLVLFCRKLSTTLSAGMSITNCLDILCESTDKPKLTQVYLRLYESIKGGHALSVAMAECGHSFPPLLVSMIESGEESGNIDLICKKLAVYYEKQQKISSKIKTATTYPKLLAILATVVVLILFTFVLPRIFEVFGNQELPAITRFMMAVSSFFINYWYLAILVAAALFLGVRMLLSTTAGRLAYDHMLLRIPKVGKLVQKIYSARFANTLAILYASGLSLLNGIRLSTSVIGNRYIESRLSEVMETVSVGNALSGAIEGIHVFDPMLPSMIRIGEETGSLDTILNTVSDFYEQETEASIDALLGILEPVLLIVMAIIIGTVLVAVMLPIFQGYGQIA